MDFTMSWTPGSHLRKKKHWRGRRCPRAVSSGIWSVWSRVPSPRIPRPYPPGHDLYGWYSIDSLASWSVSGVGQSARLWGAGISRLPPCHGGADSVTILHNMPSNVPGAACILNLEPRTLRWFHPFALCMRLPSLSQFWSVVMIHSWWSWAEAEATAKLALWYGVSIFNEPVHWTLGGNISKTTLFSSVFPRLSPSFCHENSPLIKVLVMANIPEMACSKVIGGQGCN